MFTMNRRERKRRAHSANFHARSGIKPHVRAQSGWLIAGWCQSSLSQHTPRWRSCRGGSSPSLQLWPQTGVTSSFSPAAPESPVQRDSEARRRAAASWESMLLLKTPKSFHIPQRALASARKLTFISEQYELSIRLPLLFLLLLLLLPS